MSVNFVAVLLPASASMGPGDGTGLFDVGRAKCAAQVVLGAAPCGLELLISKIWFLEVLLKATICFYAPFSRFKEVCVWFVVWPRGIRDSTFVLGLNRIR